MGKPLDSLTHEAFAQNVVRWGNLSRAYREACNVAPTTPDRSIWQSAAHLRAFPEVSRRIDELIAEAASTTTANHSAAIEFAWDVATADPNEISRTFYTCCRNCHGQGFKFQWKDVDEFALACEVIEAHNRAYPKLLKPLPSFDGGVGFDSRNPPNATCPECYGAGERHDWYCDPTTLTGKAAKLYAGLHPKTGRPYAKDQDAAWDRVCRLMGWNKEVVKVPERTVEDTGPMTPERAERAYLQLVQSK
jgi:phage terminase small subunit